MEFGRVPDTELNKVDFSLPPEPAWNKEILKREPAKNAKVYLGCAKWGRTEWVGKIYPPKTKEKDFLQHYVEHYNSIELNATHYKVYGELGIKKWAEKAKGKDFKFCPKMYKGVTHFGSLKGKEFITNEFFRGIMGFEEHLGPIFVQVSDSFSPNRRKELFDYLESLPKNLQFFLEVRHPDWFVKENIQKEMFDTLASLNMGAVITDTAGRRDCAHMHLTVPKAFIRYVGNSLHKSDYTRCDEWVKRMKHWLDNGMEELYFFMHMHDEATSPELTVYLVDKLNKECGLNLVKPTFIDPALLPKPKPKPKGLFD
ncbi:MAG: DUF72 domain-containing protein [Chitinophagaceae bacterium]|nr:DUF72 domain-containing protein [Chitinophagaceae bacterium]